MIASRLRGAGNTPVARNLKIARGFLRVTLMASALALAGCALGPDYVRPSAQLPAAYPLAQGGAVRIDAEWWKPFKDPALDALISRALTDNSDLRVAAARVAEARAASREVFARLFQEIDLAIAGSNTKNSSKAATNGNGLHRDSRTAALTTSYEIDVWGRSRRASEAAGARLLGSEYGREAIKLSVAAMVAQQYFALRAFDSQLTLTQQTRSAQADTLGIVKTRVDAGLANMLDLVRAESQLAAVDAQLASLREQRALRENQLALLTGQPGLTIAPGDLRQLSLPLAPPAGLPADLIEARPDVRAAEQVLIAANAGIGLSKAAYFPRLSLTGRLGLESQDLGDLLQAGTSTGSIGIGLALPILDFGKTTAQVDQARARTDQSFVQYQNTLQTAFKEVRDALVSLSERTEFEAAQQTRADRAEHALQLANKRYQAGYSGFLDVLDAQRTHNDAVIVLQDARRARSTATVDLYKALGGGWQMTEPPRPVSNVAPVVTTRG